jgi:hypothetical protein
VIELQSADVSQALSRYFDLRGMGRMPLGLEQAVVPVVIVGSVADDLRQGPRAIWSAWDLGALAANFGCYTIRNIPQAGQMARNVFVEKIVLYTQTTAFFRMSQVTNLATTFKLPSAERVSSLALGTPHGQLYADNLAGTIAAGVSAFSAVVAGNVPFTLDIPSSGIIIEPGGRLDIACTTANLATSCAVFWREEEI